MNNEILIVGNSPVAKINLISDFNFVILGRGIFYLKHNVLIKNWITRKCFLKLNINRKIENIHIISENYRDEYGIVNPSLGYYAVIFYLNKNYKVNITGFTLDINSENINFGSWWDLRDERDNLRHNILKETIILNKLKNKNVIYEL